MPPIIHLIRHAEGTHNLSADNHGMHDPDLTDHGISQTRELAARLSTMQSANRFDISLVLASPLHRTLRTALGAFISQRCEEKPVLIYAWPDVQEVSDLPCDSGSTLATVKYEFGGLVNCGMLEDGWELKQGKYDNTEPAVTARARAVRQWLKEQPHQHIVVFSHGCFLHFLTEDWEGSGSPEGTDWGKTELRSFEFPLHDEAALVETAESRARRGSAAALPGGEQKRLRDTTIKTWIEWEILKKLPQE